MTVDLVAVASWIVSMVSGVTVGGASPQGSAIVEGSSTTILGAKVSTWAKVAPGNVVQEVGVNLPMKIVIGPPSKPGTGPSGAIATLPFPAVVQQMAYFNHFEMQWNPHGHPPACCFGVPHFDFHFYAVPEDVVRQIGFLDPKAPTKDRLPAGFIYLGQKACVPQMGVHASRPGDMKPNKDFRSVMIAGFYNGNMHFVEPMITRAFLMKKQSFTLAVPRPATLGRETLYPTQFNGIFDPVKQEYRLVFSGFEARN